MGAVDAGIFEAWLASRVTALAPSAAHRRPWRDVLRLDPAAGELLWAAKVSGRPPDDEA